LLCALGVTLIRAPREDRVPGKGLLARAGMHTDLILRRRVSAVSKDRRWHACGRPSRRAQLRAPQDEDMTRVSEAGLAEYST
jgi:hypothetical protein